MSFLREPNAEPIPGYRLIEPLGSGGFGEVWKCEAPGGLFKAIKFVFGNLNSLDADGARAEQELHSLNRVKEVRHPFVLSMDRIEVVEGELVIVMELADKSLHDYFQECQAAGLVGIPRDTLLRYIRDAAEALDHMNDKHNLQHLDIKPRNLFLISDRVKVADFGLVKQLERPSGSVLGGVTPLYAAPETFSGTISGRSDQYSLAVVYQELLTGQRPFNGKNPRALAQQHQNEEPDLRSLPQGERAVVGRALAKDPARRFPNCLAFIRALYTATQPVRPIAGGTDGHEGRPKTLLDTMENILLEQLPDDHGLVPVELDPGVLPADLEHPACPGPQAQAGKARGVTGQAASAADEVPRDVVSDLGVTVPQPHTGALRPTVLVGVGSYGRRALLELRCRLLDRFGDLDKVPLIRFVYIDTDPEAARMAVRGHHEVALRPSEVYLLPLQPVGHYRRRHLDQLNDWLPREKLFAMPRSLKTQGSRALGRLAFTDNYLRLLTRLKREVQAACHPDTIYTTVSETGLALRENTPRVYVLGCATGGASGYLSDLGYALRRLLCQLHQPEAPVTAFLFCGAPDDPATPRGEQANLYATLTELNHFSDPAISFTAQYGTDGPRLVDEGAPYEQTYLLTQRYRTPECRREAMAHLGSYLFHELTTPLGLRLDRLRAGKGGPAGFHAAASGGTFRSLGTYGVWFPRGLMLRLAARSACSRLLDLWQGDADAAGSLLRWPTAPEADPGLEAARARVLSDSELQPDALVARLGELAGAQLDGTPRDLLTRLLAAVEDQSLQALAHDDPPGWARQALTRVQDWLGGGLAPPGVATMQQRKSRLTRALEAATALLADDWNRRLGEVVDRLLEQPGRRIAVAEAAVTSFMAFCDDAATAQHARCVEHAQRAQQAHDQMQKALAGCVETSGSFSWFGSRSRRNLRVFVDHLAAFARQYLGADKQAALLQFYSALRGRLAERLRDLTFCRQRLRHMQESLEQMFASGAHLTDGDPAEAGPPSGDALADPSQYHPVVGQGGAGASAYGWAPSSSRLAPMDVTATPGPTPIVSTESFWEAIRGSSTMRVVLPPDSRDLEEAALRFLAALTPDQWAQLDQAFQDQVLAPRGGLGRACLGTADLKRHLLSPLLSQAVACLSINLPITDVAQVEFALEGDGAERMRWYHQQAAPLLAPPVPQATPARHLAPSAVHRNVGSVGGTALPQRAPEAAPQARDRCFLLLPASEAAKRLGELAQQAVSGLHIVKVAGQADLTFCREQDPLQLEDLQPLLGACRSAYQDAMSAPAQSPHARFDIHDWIPLDP
jgi:hypothetical protein